MEIRKLWLSIFILLALLDLTNGRCQWSQWITEKQSTYTDCDKLTENKPSQLFKDVMSNGATAYTCCATDSKKSTLDDEMKALEHCFLSKCTSKEFDDYCPTRYHNGKAHKFDEIFREPCVDELKKPGFSGLCCAKKSPEGQLAAAHGAELNEFPFIVRLLSPGACGGTIYNENYIITAAHCVVGKKSHEIVTTDKVTVSIGSNFGNIPDQNPMYKYQVEEVIVHSKYSGLKDNLGKYGEYMVLWDLALLKLKKPIKFGPTVKSLRLAPANFEPRNNSDRLVIAGWGTADTLEQSPHLQKTDLLLRDPNRCFGSGGSYPQMKENNYRDQLLCVGGIQEGKFSPISGEGDSGGPAICRAPDGTAVHCGATTFGSDAKPCKDNPSEETCKPSVYVRLSYFRDWIEEKAGGQNESTFFNANLYGKHVPKGKYDHQVHITLGEGNSCGGTLISGDTVVTAATCVADDKGVKRDGLKVHFGVKDLKGKGTKSFDVKDVQVLDGFKMIGDPVDLEGQGNRIIATDNNYKNNLAVVKLDGRATSNPGKIARLPENGEVFKEAIELAMPRIGFTMNSKMVSNEFKILDKKICQSRMNRLAKGEEEMGGVSVKVGGNVMCGVEKFSGGSRCDRELGGGLICEGEDGKDVLCGVQSFRLCELSLPNAFMDMSKTASWVKSKM